MAPQPTQKVSDLSHKVAIAAYGEQSQIDPATIILISSIILEIIKMLLEYYNNDKEKCAAYLESPSKLGKVQLWNLVRKKAGGFRNAIKLFRGMLKANQSLTRQDRMDLFK
jgi:hypothetical protein